jgi:hypothetical protein
MFECLLKRLNSDLFMLVFMGPVSLVVGHRQEFGLRLLLHWLARERMGTDPLVGQPVCCGLCRESFSQEQ